MIWLIILLLLVIFIIIIICPYEKCEYCGHPITMRYVGEEYRFAYEGRCNNCHRCKYHN